MHVQKKIRRVSAEYRNHVVKGLMDPSKYAFLKMQQGLHFKLRDHKTAVNEPHRQTLWFRKLSSAGIWELQEYTDGR